MSAAPDYRLVRTLQGQVADRMTATKQARDLHGQAPLASADERQLALSFAREAVIRHRQAELRRPSPVSSPGHAYPLRSTNRGPLQRSMNR